MCINKGGLLKLNFHSSVAVNKMLKHLSQSFSELSVLRRLIFAIVSLPKDLPDLWNIAIKFAAGENVHLSESDVKIAIENLKEMDAAAFSKDSELLAELMKCESGKLSKPLGIVLLSSIQFGRECSKPLLVRKDRPSSIVMYDDILGTVPCTHYHRYCSSRRCDYKQYYGYHTKGGSSEVLYDSDWESLPYFVSSRETAFSNKLLCRINGEILVGQLSFMQCADLYNHLHNYHTPTGEISR